MCSYLKLLPGGTQKKLKLFLKAGVDPNTGNEDGLTALHQSCIDNREDMLKVLLDNGANVNIKDREMWTPLHAAATCGHKNLASHLIGRGADLLAINSDGNMPYDLCEDEETLDYIETQMAAKGITQDQIDDLREVAPNKMLEDMKKIAEAGDSLEFRDDNGATPLHIAVAQGFEKVVVFLLESKVDIHATDNDGWQPIHAAACWAQAEIIQILVEHGADLDSRTNNNETPLMICEEDEIKSLIHQLKTESLKNQRHNLVRRGSSRKNRGSSIRRSSKRDKGEMRKMDAKGEAAFIQSQEIPATNIDDVITNGSSEEPQANGQTDSNEPTTPDHVMTDEKLPESRLSEQGSTEKEEEPEPETEPEPENDLNGEASNHSANIETKRPKSILKKTPSRIEMDLDPSRKSNKDDKKSTLDRNQSQEMKQKEKEQKEKERQRLKEEKEKKKQREKEEKQKRKEEQAQRKQKEKDDKQKKDAQKPEDQAAENGAGDTVEDNLSDEGRLSLENNGTNPDTLPELKRQRQHMNSPIHSNSGSPNLSASSDRSNDTQQTDKQNGSSGDGKPRFVGSNKSGSRFSARLPFSLPFMQSYNLHDNSSNYNEQKRDSVALNEPDTINDVMPASGESDNKMSLSVETDEEPLKKFTAYPNSEDFSEDGATEACCKMM